MQRRRLKRKQLAYASKCYALTNTLPTGMELEHTSGQRRNAGKAISLRLPIGKSKLEQRYRSHAVGVRLDPMAHFALIRFHPDLIQFSLFRLFFFNTCTAEEKMTVRAESIQFRPQSKNKKRKFDSVLEVMIWQDRSTRRIHLDLLSLRPVSNSPPPQDKAKLSRRRRQS